MWRTVAELRSYAIFIVAPDVLRSYAMPMSSIVSCIRAAAANPAFSPPISTAGMTVLKLPVRMTHSCRAKLHSTPHIGCALHAALQQHVSGMWCPPHLYAWVKPLLDSLGTDLRIRSEFRLKRSLTLPTGIADLVITDRSNVTTIVEVKSAFSEHLFIDQLHACQLGAYASLASAAFERPQRDIRAVLAYAHVRAGFWACYSWRSAAGLASEAERNLQAA